MAQLSPMMAQYFEIKNQYKDAILFYRVGDFYEMFFDDALTASKELELTLTGKQCGLDEKAPMCGVPFHAYETYVARLIAKGYKVAICEQTEDPALAKGLVTRDVIRVVTPGTVIENSMLQDDKNNYICSIYFRQGKAAVCFADVSTGELQGTELSGEKLSGDLVGELCKFHPSEILMSPGVLDLKTVTDYAKQQLHCSVELMGEEEYDLGELAVHLTQNFGADWESQCGSPKDCLLPYAVGGLLSYLGRTQKKGIERIRRVQRYAQTQYMHLPAITRNNLELTETMRGRDKRGTLLWVLDQTQTAMGKRMLRKWLEQPLVDVNAIHLRLDGVEALYKDNILRADLQEAMSRVHDVERLMTRVVYGSAGPKEVYSLVDTCAQFPQIKALSSQTQSALLTTLSNQVDLLEDIRQRVEDTLDPEAPLTLKDGKVIRPGCNPEVDELREIQENSKGVLSQLEARLRQETGIPKLKIGFNRVFGYYIEISKSYLSMAPAHFIRKQTLTTGERYITEELKVLENKILGAGERLAVLERQLFEELLAFIAGQIQRVQQTATAVAALDVLASFAQVSVRNNYTKPQVDSGDEIIIREGRHPVIEQMLKGSLFVPNDTTLNGTSDRMLIITGPNMAGKSTYMRQNALIALMAQIGCFVPAAQCRVGVVDAIFTRVGASDDLAAGQSTFMVEMTELAQILEEATPKSLVILDEIGRGTSTFDGMSIARAVVEYICDPANGLGCKTLFATHYHELTDMEEELDGVKNYNIAVKKRGEDITFLRRIVRGPADDSYGIEVAKLAGLPEGVTKRARQVLKTLEAAAPDTKKVTQMDFELLEQEMDAPCLPSEAVEKLRALDLETLTPIEALNYLYQLKSDLT